LHAADVGISVNSAVDVAKDAADIVLLEKDLSVLIRGVKEGRVTFANTLKYVFMATSANFGNMFSMAGASLFLSFLPLLSKQILLTNLMTDLPEMTISTDSVDPETVVYEVMTMVGAYWLVFMWYFLLVITALDFLRLLDRALRVVPVEIKRGLNPALGLTVFILAVGIVSYGAWNARHPRVNQYDLTIAKQAGSLKQLHVVMVSDIHLGTIVHNDHLTKMVKTVNQLKPDLVLFAGDVFDETIESSDKQQIAQTFSKLSAPYGVFAVLGNA